MMRRLLFLSPLIIAAIICGYLVKVYIDNRGSLTPQSAKSVFKIAMDTSGYTNYEKNSRRTLQKFSLSVRKGVSQIREQMEFISNQRERVMDKLQEQRQNLEDQKMNAQAINDMIAHNNGLGLNLDLLRVKDLVSAIDRQTQILESSQQRLVDMNRQMREGMTKMGNALNISDANDSTAQQIVNDRLEMLRNQSSEAIASQAQFMEQAKEHMNLAKEQSAGVAQQLLDMNNLLGSMRNPSVSDIKDHVQQLLDKEHEMMNKIRENSDHIEQQRQDLKQRMEAYKEKIKDIMDANATKVDDARQKSEDLNRQNRERVADQMQRMRELRMDRQK